MTTSGFPCCHRQCIVVVFLTLVLAGLLIAPVAAAGDTDVRDLKPAPPGTPAVMYYQDFAKTLRDTHPELKTMPEMEKAKFAFSAYSKELRRVNGIWVNSNLVDRSYQGGEHTCVWHTENLQKIMRILGVKEVHSILADKNSWNFLDVNRNHHAVMVIIDGKQYVFDIWKMAVDNHGMYKDQDAGSDRYNGMPIEDWDLIMRNLDYVRFMGDSETVDPNKDTWYPSCSEAVKQIKPVNRDTEIMTTGMETVSVPHDWGNSNIMPSVQFKIPEGHTATGLKVTYDAKPGSGEMLNVWLAGINPSSGYLWYVHQYGEGNSENSGKFETRGILDKITLKPGLYEFTAFKGFYKDGKSQQVFVPASLSYYQSKPLEETSQDINR